MIKGLIFDFGNTIISQQSDQNSSLDQLNLKLKSGAKKTLKKLSQNFKIAILSNTETTTSDQLKTALKKLGLDYKNIEVFTSVSIGLRKPLPKAFKKTIECL